MDFSGDLKIKNENDYLPWKMSPSIEENLLFAYERDLPRAFW